MAIKTLLTASVLSVIGAAVSTTAFADNLVNASTFCKPGFYAGVQGGRSDTFYSPNSAMAQAINDGVGAATKIDRNADGVITGTQTDTRFNAISGAKTDDLGLGGRLYAGYQFNPYFAVEAGYTQYAKTSSHLTAVNSGVTTYTGLSPLDTGSTTFTTRYNGEISEHAVDLVAKATLPLQMGFGLYAKAGMAYIQADNSINATVVKAVTSTTPNTGNNTIVGAANRGTIYTKTYQSFSPVAGVGANYTIPNTNMSVTVDYTRVFSNGGIKNAQLTSLGLEYKFA